MIFLLILMTIQTCRGQNEKNMTADNKIDDIVYNKEQKSLLKDWDGKYSLTLNEDSEDWRNIHEIKIMIAKDSVIYSSEGFQLYEYYVLTSKENQNSINLNFLRV